MALDQITSWPLWSPFYIPVNKGPSLEKFAISLFGDNVPIEPFLDLTGQYSPKDA